MVQTSNYLLDLQLPVDGSDVRAIQEPAVRLSTAKHIALKYREELFKLVTASKTKSKTGSDTTDTTDNGPQTLFYGTGPNINDLIHGIDDTTALDNCIRYIAHVRQLLHLQVRRRRRLSARGKKMFQHLNFGEDDSSDDSSDGGLESMDR